MSRLLAVLAIMFAASAHAETVQTPSGPVNVEPVVTDLDSPWPSRCCRTARC